MVGEPSCDISPVTLPLDGTLGWAGSVLSRGRVAQDPGGRRVTLPLVGALGWAGSMLSRGRVAQDPGGKRATLPLPGTLGGLAACCRGAKSDLGGGT
jgi:hypothetical protein